MNKVLIIGKGGREHALAWKFASYSSVGQVFCAPGNPGIANENKVSAISIEADDINELVKFAKKETVLSSDIPYLQHNLLAGFLINNKGFLTLYSLSLIILNHIQPSFAFF